jgi:transposase
MTKALVTDELWSIVKPLLPAEQPKPKGGRPRVSDRAALTGILFVLRSGIPWEMLPQEKRLRLGRDMLAPTARLARSRGVGQTAPRTPAAPASSTAYRLEPSLCGQRVHPGKKGGAATGLNPTDRGKAGTKRHLLTDLRALPLAFVLTGANVHDSVPLAELLDAVVPVKGRPGKPRQRPGKLHADKAYDAKRCRRACRQRGIEPCIARRGVDSSERLGRHRWVVERTLAWFARMRRLSIRYERRLDIHHTFTSLACSLICFNALRRRF